MTLPEATASVVACTADGDLRSEGSHGIPVGIPAVPSTMTTPYVAIVLRRALLRPNTALLLHAMVEHGPRLTRMNPSMTGPLFSNDNGCLTVRGELDLLSVPELESWLARADGQRYEVDLSGVTFFDSCALRAFLNARRVNTKMVIVRPSKAVLNVLQITGTVDYLVGGRDVIW